MKRLANVFGNPLISYKDFLYQGEDTGYRDLLYRGEDPGYRDLLDRGEDGGYELLSSGIDPELQQALKVQKLFFDTGVMGGPGRS